ncbi:hypothetical protein NBRC110019_24970 [Neptunitalea chrysea]|uniref:Uncharacterized protein n=1 Tax=Neptunitalea chrysea TaxID=1647581 RepID=A0A9W6B6K0_9FLAO|nr:hypothetical protein [Neptunitalea chrysea]GLB53456.1 hypothetical protein NBRC110019_24970 [Neptunitalea chrysea]
MVTEKEAIDRAVSYLEEIGSNYIKDSITIHFNSIEDHDNTVPIGKYEGENFDVYAVGYDIPWAPDVIVYFLYVRADTGELLYIITPTNYIEIE